MLFPLAFSSQHCSPTHLREMVDLSEQVSEHVIYVVHLWMVEHNTFSSSSIRNWNTHTISVHFEFSLYEHQLMNSLTGSKRKSWKINSIEKAAWGLHQTFLWHRDTNTLGHMHAHIHSLDLSVNAIKQINNAQRELHHRSEKKQKYNLYFGIRSESWAVSLPWLHSYKAACVTG